MPRSYSPRRALALSLALLLAAWANLDLTAFHGLRGADSLALAAPSAPQLASSSAAPAARATHDANHLCAFASVAHTAHAAALSAEPAPLVGTERLPLDSHSARPIPGRTASGLAPPA